MIARFRRMAARLRPDSLFGRLAMILFSGLVAAHVLAFGLIVLDRIAIVDDLDDKFAIVDIADAVAILDYVRPEERPAWLDRLARHDYRYGLRAEGELEAEPISQRRQANIARLRTVLGAGHDANFVTFDSPKRSRRGLLMHLKDGSPLTLETLTQKPIISPWLPAALAVQLCIIAFFVWLAVKHATQPLARLELAANSLGPDLRGELLPENGPKEVARTAIAFNVMQRRIAEQVAERIQILAAISHDLQTPITRMRLRTDFLGDGNAKEKLQVDLLEMQTLVKQGLDLAREYDIGSAATADVAVPASRGHS